MEKQIPRKPIRDAKSAPRLARRRGSGGGLARDDSFHGRAVVSCSEVHKRGAARREEPTLKGEGWGTRKNKEKQIPRRPAL